MDMEHLIFPVNFNNKAPSQVTTDSTDKVTSVEAQRAQENLKYLCI
jgi:hypothetical protein